MASYLTPVLRSFWPGLVLLLLAQIGGAGEFVNLGFQPEGVSGDGRLVYGSQYIEATNTYYPVMWTRETGKITLGNGHWSASGRGAVSSDGRVIVGAARSLIPTPTGQFNNIFPFRWTNEEGLQTFGDYPPLLTDWDNGYAFDVSADGTVVVGRSRKEAFRWTADTGMLILPPVVGKPTGYQSAVTQSGDGKVIAGSYGEDVTNIDSTFRWTEETGSVDIGRLPGSTSMRPRDISADGETIVGVSYQNSNGSLSQAWKWTPNDGFDVLGVLTGHQGSEAMVVSDDGKVVLGSSFTGSDQGQMFWWAATDGLNNLSSRLFDEFDALVVGRSASPTGISRDRRTVVGRGHAQNAGWLAVFDSALGGSSIVLGDFNNDGHLDSNDIDLLYSHLELADPEYDLNGDDFINDQDIAHWVHNLAHTYFGDANLDGQFNSSDLVAVFQSGKYETDQKAGWSNGDWNGDGVFGTSDLVIAFQDGGYEQGPRAAVSAVPEPSTALLLGLAAAFTASRTRRKRF